MPHIRTTVKAGRTIEVWEGYSWNYGKENLKREKPKKKTSEQMEQENERQRERRVRLLINNNFSPGDLYITLSYRKGQAPPEPEQIKKDMERFVRRIRRDSRGQPVKYLYVIEVGKRGARHAHIVISDVGIPPKRLSDLWGQGMIRIDPLDNTGDYSKLAAYMVKYIKKTTEALGLNEKRKGYSPSRNLVMPKLTRRIIRRRKLSTENNLYIPKSLKGKVEVIKDSIRSGVSVTTGYDYISYRLVVRTNTRARAKP